MKITILDPLDLLEAHRTVLHDLGDLTVYNTVPQTEAELSERIADSELAIVAYAMITETVLKQAAHLKYLVVPGVGYDHVDLRAATAAGIKVINCPTHNTRAVAEYTIGLMFAITRKIVASHLAIQQGVWDSFASLGMELQGKQLGLIGYGSIGRAVAKLAQALEMQVSTVASKASEAELEQLIASADILSLHLPLTSQSRHLLNQRRLSLMKPTAYLINTARGAIVDQDALFVALQEKRIAGAALDVFENEPTTATVSEKILALSRLDNVITTAHIAYNTEASIERLGEELISNIQACIQGQCINIVN